MSYKDNYDNFLNIDSLTWDQINSINVDSMIQNGGIPRWKISNLSVETLDVSTSWYMRSGKVSFTDTVNPWWYQSNKWIYFGTAWDTKSLKYDVSAWTIVFKGVDLSWSDITGSGKPDDNATAGATLGVNVSGGSTDSNKIDNSGYLTNITADSITTGTITVGSSSVGLTVDSGGDILMESSNGYSFSSILFRNGSSGWDVSYVGAGGGGYNAWELLFEPQGGSSTISFGSFGLTTVGIYTQLNVFGDVTILKNLYLDWNLIIGWSMSFWTILPSSAYSYYLWSSSEPWIWTYATTYNFCKSWASSRYIQLNSSSQIECNAPFYFSNSIILWTVGFNPSTPWQIVNYSSWWTSQFRGIPWSWPWRGSFDMSAA